MALAADKLGMISRIKFEHGLTNEYSEHRSNGEKDLAFRMGGVSAQAGASGLQFAGYRKLEQFYRGDQFVADEPKGASQKVDNYCAVVVDNLSSIIFDDNPEINCPTDDPTDDLLELYAEAKERLLWRVWEENDFDVVLDELSKVSSLYGDGFIKGPWAEQNKKGHWVIKFSNIDNPSSVIPIWKDASRTELEAFIHYNDMSASAAEKKWGAKARDAGINLGAAATHTPLQGLQTGSQVPTVKITEYWTDEIVAYFVDKRLLDWKAHNWGFVPLEYMKNIHSPNHPFGKSDIEDILDPQLSHNRTNNDLANLLRWLSTINLWGKNLEGMQALVAGLSRIYSLPDEGELHTFEKPGDPYITDTYAKSRRSAIIEISGVSEASLSSSQLAGASGRALAVAFQGTLRKLNPKTKRYKKILRNLNTNIFKLFEIYYPDTKQIIRGDYRNEVHLPQTLLRNIVDTINKFSSGLISQETAMREAGVAQPKLEKKIMEKDLLHPVLGPQVARQPALLPQLNEGQNQPGDQPNPQSGNQPSASPEGAVAANRQQAGGPATPAVTE